VQPVPTAEFVLIIDFGSQYTQLIARRVRQAGVYCEIHSYEVAARTIHDLVPVGVILSGGPESAALESAPQIPPAIFELSVPVLGICYGMQAMAQHFGGRVETSGLREFGYARCSLQDSNSPLFAGLEKSPDEDALDVWMSHGDRVTALPDGFHTLAASDNAPIAAMANTDRSLFGLQFHPEVTHTPQGQTILENFLTSVCGCNGLWAPAQIIDSIVEEITTQTQAGGEVILGLSGGVDSAVAAALLHKALGDRLTCLFIDNGLLRQDEANSVMDALSSQGDNRLQFRVRRIDAEKVFLRALAGVTDPEAKRKVIGQTFIQVFAKEARQMDNVRWLGQGTIYPDVIESAAATTQKAHLIKSHHNVGGLPDKLPLPLIEPLKSLFKDEVRRIGTALGLPDSLINRHPFPGPGLGVRILGEVKPAYIDILRRADALFLQALEEADLYDQVSQAFAVFLPVKSVGVTGDARRYQYVISLRAVTTTDFMTARWAELPHDFLGRVANRILNEIQEVSRVVYDISSKPPATIEWE